MGKLFYVVGASGVGKDTLMNYARANIGGSKKVIFAHRYITRDAFAGGENHVALTNEEFLLRRDAGLFALDWESHNQHYGIGIEINTWLQLGFNVVVNGSRQYLPQAKLRYPDMADVLIDADPGIIAQRLAARNRESGEEIKNRMGRSGSLTSHAEYAYVIQNSGLVEEAGERLIGVIGQGEQGFNDPVNITQKLLLGENNRPKNCQIKTQAANKYRKM